MMIFFLMNVIYCAFSLFFFLLPLAKNKIKFREVIRVLLTK